MFTTCYIDSLADELLEEIFLISLAQSMSIWKRKTEENMISLCEDRGNLCLVAYRWNSIIILSPRLWSDIFISYEVCPNPCSKFLKTWFKRSSDALLNITLNLNNTDIKAFQEYLWYFDLIKINISRIRKLSIYTVNAYHCVASIPFHLALKLECLEVNRANREWDDRDMQCTRDISIAVAAAPTLTDLSWAPYNNLIASNFLSTKFPFQRLTNINLRTHTISLNNFIRILRNCTQAKEVAFYVQKDWDTDDEIGTRNDNTNNTNHNVRVNRSLHDKIQNHTIHLPNLQHLLLYLSKSDYQILSMLDVPNLKMLALSCDRPIGTPAQNSASTSTLSQSMTQCPSIAISNFISSSRHSIQFLHIVHYGRNFLLNLLSNDNIIDIPTVQIQVSCPFKDVEEIRETIINVYPIYKQFEEELIISKAFVFGRGPTLRVGWLDEDVEIIMDPESIWRRLVKPHMSINWRSAHCTAVSSV